jgi:cobalt-precorrin 5A hydrolase/precorrin-3B C17-methyltransferase
MTAEPAIVVLARAALSTGRRIATVTGGEVHAPASVVEADTPIPEVAPHLRDLFAAGRPIVGVCAAGILVRALAPVLGDKHAEPPVLAVAADGASVVPLLGGHRGANALAARLADALGGHAAVTTLSEVAAGVSLDAPPPGWTLASASEVKPLLARLRDGGRVRVDDGDCPADWLAELRHEDGPVDVAVSIRRTRTAPATLIPQRLALGVGCERGLPAEDLATLVDDTLAAHDLDPVAVGVVVSLDLKAGEPAVRALADRLGVEARFFDAATLEAETPRLATPSEAVFREVGCHGVAEGAALAAVGPEGGLLVPKAKGPRATVAIAEAPAPLDAARIGRPGGRLRLLSLGPGDRSQRTRAVDAALRRVDDLVGYSGYLDPLEAEIRAARHGFPLGGEVDRCRFALELAREGREVGLVGSGDVGIYAMAALVHELAADEPAWQGVPIEALPGVSAMHMAAARAGAPLGHDFCAVSLSDLLTPWAVIEQRLEAAAAGDFVTALYNPVSQARRAGFERARAIFAAKRPASTPCLVARQLGRTDERVTVTTLAELGAAEVDMLTLVIVGSAKSRAWRTVYGREQVFTPRGYGDT